MSKFKKEYLYIILVIGFIALGIYLLNNAELSKLDSIDYSWFKTKANILKEGQAY